MNVFPRLGLPILASIVNIKKGLFAIYSSVCHNLSEIILICLFGLFFIFYPY